METDLLELADAARHDLSCACGSTGRSRGAGGSWIYPAALPDGRTMPILKVALSSACERDCLYCALRVGRDCRRHSFTPDRLARVFDDLHRAGTARGIFLTSGIAGGPVRTMDRLLATAAILRRRYRFLGYIHLKIIPGCERAQVERAVRIATRVSVNLEAPNATHLAAICPRKGFDSELMTAMSWVSDLIRARAGSARSQTTQFVVGASTETDREIVSRVGELYGPFGLARAYYSAFQPQEGTPLDGRPPTSFVREHRLYQADFLIRKYGFQSDEIPFEADGNLSRERDPKEAWAALHPETFPVEVNTADRRDLLRVPGIGPEAADRIIERRRLGRLRRFEELGLTRSLAAKAARFLLLDGREPPRQLELNLQ